MTDRDLTPLDEAHAAMEAAEGATAEAAGLRFYDRLALSELFLMLEAEPEGDQIRPQIFELETGPVVLAFDREDRLAGFAGAPVPYAGLSGRALAEMLAGQGLGLGLNLDVAPSATLLPPDALSWLSERLSAAPEETEARPRDLAPPRGLPEALFPALEDRLRAAGGLASLAYLAAVTYEAGPQSHLLAFIDPLPGAEGALARAVQGALSFSGIEAGALDVAFFAAADPMAATLARVGLRIDLPQPEAPNGPAAPGMDPDAPPRLR